MNATPGPWHVGVEGEHVGAGGVAGHMVALMAPQDWPAIARGAGVPAFPENAAERRANVHLVAAAPELLAAVRDGVTNLSLLVAQLPRDHPLRAQIELVARRLWDAERATFVPSS